MLFASTPAVLLGVLDVAVYAIAGVPAVSGDCPIAGFLVIVRISFVSGFTVAA
jgi:hypothetical protein